MSFLSDVIDDLGNMMHDVSLSIMYDAVHVLHDHNGADRQTNRRTDKQTNRQTDGRTDGQMDIWTNRHTEGHIEVCPPKKRTKYT